VGRLTFGVGSVQFAGQRRSLPDEMLAVLPVVVVVSSFVVLVAAVCACFVRRRVAAVRRRKLGVTRTEFNVNYVHVSEPSIQSADSSAAAAPASARADTGVHLPHNSQSALCWIPYLRYYVVLGGVRSIAMSVSVCLSVRSRIS